MQEQPQFLIGSLMDGQFCVAVVSGQKTSLALYALDEGCNHCLLVQELESVEFPLHSLTPVKGQVGALVGSATKAFYIW